jgi:hypothetical protein
MRLDRPCDVYFQACSVGFGTSERRCPTTEGAEAQYHCTTLYRAIGAPSRPRDNRMLVRISWCRVKTRPAGCSASEVDATIVLRLLAGLPVGDRWDGPYNRGVSQKQAKPRRRARREIQGALAEQPRLLAITPSFYPSEP